MRKLISIAILGLVFVGAGLALGAYLWRDRAIERDELQRIADNFERDLAVSEERARVATDRAVNLEADITDARGIISDITERAARAESRIDEIIGAFEQSSGELGRAIDRGESVNILIERAIEIVQQLQRAIGTENPMAGN